MNTQQSAPIQLLQHVWNNMQKATSHSWLKVNHALSEALSLAVRSGMSFHEDDFRRIFRNASDGGFRAGYWIGADTEWFYRLAVLYRNASAWKTYEKWAERTPFIWKAASLSVNTGDGPCGQGLARLVVGAEFQWERERVKVTSFRDGAEPYVVACSYQRDGKAKSCKSCKHTISWPQDVLNHRYKITHKDLREAQRKLKQCA